MGTSAVLSVRGTETVRADRNGLALLTEFLKETAGKAGVCRVERAIYTRFGRYVFCKLT